ncbi:hypothetical protein ADK41_26200 [Streptomyces caelestis]|uniref:AG2 protein n=1 Tax=Streptomyces caelestis TaxID=36816 RepID=A0A0M8QP00_9ACTN|nr:MULTISPECIES: DUF6571 family protein [Streptomyces]KOT34533.1 hypothetical protein ADK41_26200 [Streptomyces caelestis]
MEIDTLRDANFALLDDAVDDWSTLVKSLEGLKKDAEDDLRKSADNADWAGVNAEVSKEFIGKTAGEFADAHTQAKSIHQILSDTVGELKGYHRQLVEAIDGGRKKNLTVIAYEGGFTVTTSAPPEARRAMDQDDKGHITALRDEIQGILDKAAESDDSARTVLQALVDQSEMGFSDASYADRDSAAKAIADAEAMARVAKKDPHEVTNTELAALNSALVKYKTDPLFAERFATSVGPKGLLDFWAGIADPYQAAYDPARSKQAKQLQKNLGITIGRATLSDSAAMASWKSKMLGLGENQLGIDDASNPTGFAVMSNLMRFGDYDDRFLNDYGNKLIGYDKKVNGEGVSLWVNNVNQGDLNFWDYKNDRGRDPMTGFLEALGHNPDASTQFFASPDVTSDPNDKNFKVNEHLKYLTQERVWVSDTTLQGDDDYVAGRDALGHALEAATTGFAHDTDVKEIIAAGGGHRTADTAAVMEQVSYLYGSENGPKMLHEQPELADSLGKMAGAYIDDIDYSLSGVGDHMRDQATFPPQYHGRANFTEEGAINFLSVLGQNETSHAAVTAAQHLYTLSAMDAHPPTSEQNIERAHDALMNGAEVRGILDNSRVQQAETTYKGDAEEANKSLGRSSDWVKVGAGAVVAGGIAAVPLPGSTAAALVIAPVAADTAGQVVNTFIGHGVDHAVDDKEQKPAEKAQMTSTEFYGKGAEQLGSAYSAYVNGSKGGAEVANKEKWASDIESAYYGVGSHENEHRGRTPYED